MIDYHALIGTTLQAYANSKLRTVDSEELTYSTAPTVQLSSFDNAYQLFTADLQTGDVHDGKQVYISAYAVEMLLGLDR